MIAALLCMFQRIREDTVHKISFVLQCICIIHFFTYKTITYKNISFTKTQVFPTVSDLTLSPRLYVTRATQPILLM